MMIWSAITTLAIFINVVRGGFFDFFDRKEAHFPFVDGLPPVPLAEHDDSLLYDGRDPIYYDSNAGVPIELEMYNNKHSHKHHSPNEARTITSLQFDKFRKRHHTDWHNYDVNSMGEGYGSLACPDNYVLNEEEHVCVKVEYTRPQVACPLGAFRSSSDGTCLMFDSIPPERTCPAGYSYFVRGCIRIKSVNPIDSCPSGYIKQNDDCWALTETVANATCPVEYIYRDIPEKYVIYNPLSEESHYEIAMKEIKQIKDKLIDLYSNKSDDDDDNDSDENDKKKDSSDDNDDDDNDSNDNDDNAEESKESNDNTEDKKLSDDNDDSADDNKMFDDNDDNTDDKKEPDETENTKDGDKEYNNDNNDDHTNIHDKKHLIDNKVDSENKLDENSDSLEVNVKVNARNGSKRNSNEVIKIRVKEDVNDIKSDNNDETIHIKIKNDQNASEENTNTELIRVAIKEETDQTTESSLIQTTDNKHDTEISFLVIPENLTEVLNMDNNNTDGLSPSEFNSSNFSATELSELVNDSEINNFVNVNLEHLDQSSATSSTTYEQFNEEYESTFDEYTNNSILKTDDSVDSAKNRELISNLINSLSGRKDKNLSVLEIDGVNVVLSSKNRFGEKRKKGLLYSFDQTNNIDVQSVNLPTNRIPKELKVKISNISYSDNSKSEDISANSQAVRILAPQNHQILSHIHKSSNTIKTTDDFNKVEAILNDLSNQINDSLNANKFEPYLPSQKTCVKEKYIQPHFMCSSGLDNYVVITHKPEVPDLPATADKLSDESLKLSGDYNENILYTTNLFRPMCLSVNQTVPTYRCKPGYVFLISVDGMDIPKDHIDMTQDYSNGYCVRKVTTRGYFDCPGFGQLVSGSLSEKSFNGYACIYKNKKGKEIDLIAPLTVFPSHDKCSDSSLVTVKTEYSPSMRGVPSCSYYEVTSPIPNCLHPNYRLACENFNFDQSKTELLELGIRSLYNHEYSEERNFAYWPKEHADLCRSLNGKLTCLAIESRVEATPVCPSNAVLERRRMQIKPKIIEMSETEVDYNDELSYNKNFKYELLTPKTELVEMCVLYEVTSTIGSCMFGNGEPDKNGNCKIVQRLPTFKACPEGFTKASADQYDAYPHIKGMIRKNMFMSPGHLLKEEPTVCQLVKYADYSIRCPEGYRKHKPWNHANSCVAEKKISPSVICPPSFMPKFIDMPPDLNDDTGCVKITRVAPSVLTNQAMFVDRDADYIHEADSVSNCQIGTSGGLTCGLERKFTGRYNSNFITNHSQKMHEKKVLKQEAAVQRRAPIKTAFEI